MRNFINRRQQVEILAVVLAVVCARGAFAAASEGEDAAPPNIVIIFCDDLGYGDLGCYGHPTIRTPRLDRMAAEGMRFTQFYSAASVCTPSRAALLTGRLPIRSGMCAGGRRVLFPDSEGGLPAEEVTIAEALRAKGYRTACIGKWHLGHLPDYLPTRHGFDSYFGIPYSNDMLARPRANRPWPPLPLMRDEEVIESDPDQGVLTERYTEEAIKFIRDCTTAAERRPFFLYLPHTMPHVPLYASDRFRETSARGLYGDVIETIDWSTGQILDALRTAGAAENTLVFFTSDNGPWLTQDLRGGSAGLLRGGKGSTWEGGVREPGVAWWPGRVPAGEITHAVASTMDLFTTALALAGVEAPNDRTMDGHDLAPVLFGEGASTRELLFYYRGSTLMAVRKGAWKLHLKTQDGYGQRQPAEHEPPLLFHLEHDPSEKYDVAGRHADVIDEILADVARHQAEMKPGKSQL